MAEQKYVFDEEHEEHESKIAGFLNFLWNSKTKEFLGRDGMSWAKVSFFYAVFYLLLGGFFVGMLAVFAAMLPLDKPTYYGKSSVMNARGLNPGLGFRPQIDVEDYVIKYNPLVDVHQEFGLQRYSDNLRNFLNAKYKYKPEQAENLIACSHNQSYETDFKHKKSCSFDYEQIFKNTPCSGDKHFGYKTSQPCVLIKINKIVSWEPETKDGFIKIKCGGEFAFDRDNVNSITYYSEGDTTGNKEHGLISAKYFPFMGQKEFRMPFIWARFDVTANTYLNIECKAYADNIDNDDRLNRRGQTKFALYVANKVF